LKLGSAGNPPTHVFNTKLEGGAKRWVDLKNRVVEHVSETNMFVMAIWQEFLLLISLVLNFSLSRLLFLLYRNSVFC
jgi:hypothetical protein